jgi:hypothetical protein
MQDVKYTRADAQADVVKLLSGNVVLVGHSLDNDLKSLQLDFQPVIDTSFLFRYKCATLQFVYEFTGRTHDILRKLCSLFKSCFPMIFLKTTEYK